MPGPEPARGLPPAHLKPIAPGVYSLQVSLDQQTVDRLRRAQALLSHAIPSGDLSQVLDRAILALVGKLERRKAGATPAPRAARESRNPRHIPAQVRRAVWERDGGQCTFVSATGHRCTEQRFIEFDHVLEVSRGGDASIGNLRLRCRAHNLLAAEHTFGRGFMQARRGRAVAKAPADPPPGGPADLDVVPWLRALGYRADEAREAAQHVGAMVGATLEQRVRAALAYFHPRIRHPHGRGAAA